MVESPQTDLTSLGALEAAAQARDLPAHIERLLGAAHAAAGPEQAAVLRTLAAALQIDLAYLHAHPEDLFPALFMRCALHDSAQGKRLGAPGPEAPTGGALSALAQRWRKDFEQRGRPWVQTLLPPEHEPGGPLIAELRVSTSWRLYALSKDGDVYLRRTRQKAPALHTRWSVRTGELSAVGEAACQPPPGPAWLRVELGPRERVTLHDSALGTARELPIPEYGSVTGHAFSADGRLLAISGYVDMYVCGFLRVYETATAKVLHDFETRRAFHSDTPRITPCGRYVIALNDEGLHLWDLTQHQGTKTARNAAETFPLCGDFPEAVLSPDGRRLAVRNSREVVRLYDLADLRAVTRRLSRPQHPLLFSPDGGRVLVGGWLCDGRTGRRLRRLELPEGDGDNPPDGSFCFGTARILDLADGVRVWNSATGGSRSRRRKERYEKGDIIAFTRDGGGYATCSSDRPVHVEMDEVREALRARGEAALEALRDARSGSQPVFIRDADTGAVRTTLPDQDVTALAFSRDGRLLATGTRQGAVAIWDVGTAARVSTPPAHAAAIATLCFSEDGRLLASAGDHEALRVSQVADGAEVAARPLGESDPTYVYYHSGQKMAVRETRRTWRASHAALQQIREWVGFAVTPPPVPRYRAEVVEGVTRIVDAATGAKLARLPHEGPWTAHPAAAIWAGPFAHLQLRGAP